MERLRCTGTFLAKLPCFVSWLALVTLRQNQLAVLRIVVLRSFCSLQETLDSTA